MRGKPVVLPCLCVFGCEFFEISCPRIPCIVQHLKLKASGDIAGVTECLERPVPHKDIVSRSDKIVKSVVCHGLDGIPSQSPCKPHGQQKQIGDPDVMHLRSFSRIIDTVFFFSSNIFVLEFTTTPGERNGVRM